MIILLNIYINLGYARHFKELKEQKIWLPESDEEQQKIVEILSDCDTVIEQVKIKLIVTFEKEKAGSTIAYLIASKLRVEIVTQ